MTEKDLTATDNPDGKKPDSADTGPSTTVPGAAGAGASAPDLDPQSRPAGGSTPGHEGVGQDEDDSDDGASAGQVSEPSANPVPPAADATTDPETHDTPQTPTDQAQGRPGGA